jgi:pyruvate kinase
MLSAETSAGKYPTEAAKMMGRIAMETDAAIRSQGFTNEVRLSANSTTPQVIADAAFHVAHSADVSAIAVGTSSGATARLVARYRPPVPVFAFTASEAVARQLSIIYGIEAIVAPACNSTDDMLQQMEKTLVGTGRVKPGECVVFLAGQPVNRSGTTNLLNLHRMSAII